jgi:acyl-CoA thioesterase FadM
VTPEHVESLRVHWVDTDAGGRIHFSNALRWAELAEEGLRRRLGLLDDWGSYPRRLVEAQFHRVLVFDDAIDVSIRPGRVGTTSIEWAWRIARSGELCVEGRMVVVHVDGEGRPAPLPEAVRAALSPA